MVWSAGGLKQACPYFVSILSIPLFLAMSCCTCWWLCVCQGYPPFQSTANKLVWSFSRLFWQNACLQFGCASSRSQKGGECQRRSTTNSQVTVSYRQRRLKPTVVVKVHVQDGFAARR